ncbi:transmembrane and coiled-coil domains protein 1-like [Pyrus ussuriensis x Pyrus communis]|uniref:Transmembrane and coiled-coil domains protein 1-like n=1 Tax=Pyrus ussuriensis x Pyrus communis TaxID=2448454 RepID=A0A5N5GMD3_9ROSA|nr:transmembrane and coiled-coil domains protein 1-like [Pyrus ussuriensis x Pyrus communis]
MGSLTNSYKSLCSSIDKAAKKLETSKINSSSATKFTKKSKTKKIGRVKTRLKESSGDLSFSSSSLAPSLPLSFSSSSGYLARCSRGRWWRNYPSSPLGW